MKIWQIYQFWIAWLHFIKWDIQRNLAPAGQTQALRSVHDTQEGSSATHIELFHSISTIILTKLY
jgi:hypothetical protein